eukprot:COSAG06_NODE_62848_length_264_cov_0.569697_1_plen_47_part_01
MIRVGAGLPKGSVEFSLLSEDTHIRPHCGPSNVSAGSIAVVVPCPAL